MSFISRLQGQFTKITRNMPAFQPLNRGLDFSEKGRAEENVYFRKEQARLLTKLRKLFSGQQKVQPSDAGKPNKGNDRNDKK